MEHVIRAVRADEWQKVKELRLAAVGDPVASIAFLETVEQAAAKPDEFWQERAAGAAWGVAARQFIAEAADGEWGGTVTVLVEKPGVKGFFGEEIPVTQGHLVGVFVRKEFRGSGLTERLFQAALEWVWELEEPRLERARLFVHSANERAAGFYRKFGFVESGLTIPAEGVEGLEVEMVFTR
ncbi:GNAT family N-acetyltransferase [Streptomyces beijiangensis]|uniref:N-acetyltransferase n=1 Tax=Streptomyces beijiangensis TaxID=163361 RepID=A0A939FFW2_9ACTN|nr:GNAT family N-acetyltransferase [Streptomyces beijiangensis]MBO0516657.1 N-acetyltransferase [Streptomyces beijiangensis]